MLRFYFLSSLALLALVDTSQPARAQAVGGAACLSLSPPVPAVPDQMKVPQLVQSEPVTGRISSASLKGGELRLTLDSGEVVRVRDWPGQKPWSLVGGELRLTTEPMTYLSGDSSVLTVQRAGAIQLVLAWNIQGGHRFADLPWTVSLWDGQLTLRQTEGSETLQLRAGQSGVLPARTQHLRADLLSVITYRPDAAERPAEMVGGPQTATLMVTPVRSR